MLGRSSRALLLVAGFVLLNLAMVSLWSWRTFASSQGFADATTDMLKEPAVREAVADQIVDGSSSRRRTRPDRRRGRGRSSSRSSPTSSRPTRSRVCSTPASASCTRRSSRAGAAACSCTSTTPRSSCKDGLAAVNPELADVDPRRRPVVAVGVSQSTPIDTTMRCRRSPAGWRCPFAVGRADLLRDGGAAGARPAAGVRSDRARPRRHRRGPLRPARRSASTSPPASATTCASAPRCAPCSGAPRTSSTCRPRSPSRSAPCSRRGRPGRHGADPHPPRRRSVDRVALAARRAGCGGPLACLAAIAAGFFAMRWPEATTSIVIRVVAFVAFVAGAIGLLDVLGSVDWVQTASGTSSDRHGASPRASRRRSPSSACRCCSAASLRAGPAGAGRRPRRDGRGRLQRPRRAVRPAAR